MIQDVWALILLPFSFLLAYGHARTASWRITLARGANRTENGHYFQAGLFYILYAINYSAYFLLYSLILLGVISDGSGVGQSGTFARPLLVWLFVLLSIDRGFSVSILEIPLSTRASNDNN